ncbi:hypothetical protein niasHT_039267 [Heterodera trifolii]|uniref:ISXO2-like transposase domain-containing protein n=1 Tax=Heterodera trifolii TaxID=157864 RepID=A0ABD2I966_9BILA
MEIKPSKTYPEGFVWRCRAKFRRQPPVALVRLLPPPSVLPHYLLRLRMLPFASAHKKLEAAERLWKWMSQNLEKGSIGKVIEWMVVGSSVGLTERLGVFMEVVEKRDAETLVPLIKKWIHPGSIVVSDYWRAYDCLGSHGYKHLKVNHSINFVDKDDPTINTNRIESTWRHCKESFSTHGRVKHHVPGNLARYMFVKAARSKKVDVTEEFLRMAAHVYADKGHAESDVELDDEDLDIFE